MNYCSQMWRSKHSYINELDNDVQVQYRQAMERYDASELWSGYINSKAASRRRWQTPTYQNEAAHI